MQKPTLVMMTLALYLLLLGFGCSANDPTTERESSSPTLVRPASTPARAYTDRERQLYREVKAALYKGASNESEVVQLIAKTKGMAPQELEAIVDRVDKVLTAGNKNREQEIREAVERLAQIKDVTVIRDQVTVTYVETMETITMDSQKAILEEAFDRLERVVEAILSISEIDAVNLTANFSDPRIDEVVLFQLIAHRSEFTRSKRPYEYRGFRMNERLKEQMMRKAG